MPDQHRAPTGPARTPLWTLEPNLLRELASALTDLGERLDPPATTQPIAPAI